MATFDSTQPGLVHDHLNQPRPRRLRCVRCGDTMVLPPDAPEVIDDPPMGWISRRSAVTGRDSTSARCVSKRPARLTIQLSDGRREQR